MTRKTHLLFFTIFYLLFYYCADADLSPLCASPLSHAEFCPSIFFFHRSSILPLLKCIYLFPKRWSSWRFHILGLKRQQLRIGTMLERNWNITWFFCGCSISCLMYGLTLSLLTWSQHITSTLHNTSHWLPIADLQDCTDDCVWGQELGTSTLYLSHSAPWKSSCLIHVCWPGQYDGAEYVLFAGVLLSSLPTS